METQYGIIIGIVIILKIIILTIYCCVRASRANSSRVVVIGRHPGQDRAAIVNHAAPISTSDVPPNSVRVPPRYPPSHPAQRVPAPGAGTNRPAATAPYGRPACGFQPPAGQYGFVQADSKGPPPPPYVV